MMFQDLATWNEMNIETDGYEEEGEYLHGRDTFNYFSDIFHISHGPHEGEKYHALMTNSNTLSTKIFLFCYFYLIHLIDNIFYPYPISERRVVRLINLFVSVTDDSCFKQCEEEYIGGNPQPNLQKLRDCKARNCKHVDSEDNIDVTIACLTCHEDELSSSFWDKAKNVYKFGPNVEKIHNGGQHLFKYSVPPGLYEIKCRLEKQFQLLNVMHNVR